MKEQECLSCGKRLTKRQNKFCSNQYQRDYYYSQYITRWKNGLEDGLNVAYGISHHIKKYLFLKHNKQCELCGWGETNPYTETISLEVHHKDGDFRNNNESNLQLLCPNYHSLTNTYKSHNKIGRKKKA